MAHNWVDARLAEPEHYRAAHPFGFTLTLKRLDDRRWYWRVEYHEDHYMEGKAPDRLTAERDLDAAITALSC